MDVVFYELNDITLVTFRQGHSALDAYFGWATPGGGESRPYKTRAVTSVVVVVGWAGANLNPHPLKAEGAAPRRRVGVFSEVDQGKEARRRRTTRSWPKATIVSKRGGATDWPTMATRVALMRRPAFTPPDSATAREAWSQAS